MPITINGVLFETEGTIIDSFLNVNGCDSIIKNELIVYDRELIIPRFTPDNDLVMTTGNYIILTFTFQVILLQYTIDGGKKYLKVLGAAIPKTLGMENSKVKTSLLVLITIP